MGKKKKGAAAAGVAAEQPQQQQQQQQQPRSKQQQQRHAPASPSSDSDASDSSDYESPAPVAAASSSSKRVMASSAKSNSHGNNHKSGRARSNSLESFLPPAFGDLGEASPRSFTLVSDRSSADWPARVPHRSYLEPTLPPGSWKRVWRRLYWKWRVHSVAQMFDPLETAILNIGALAIGTAATAYAVSTVAGMVL
jgi:hypothetical protein